MVNMPLAQLQVFIALAKWLVKLLKQLIDKFAVTCMSKCTCRHATFEKLLRDLKTVRYNLVMLFGFKMYRIQ